MEKDKVRKNLKFSNEKKEQKNAAIFLSKIEREQTAFVSYLTNQFLASHGVTDAESITKEDAMMLFYNLKDEFESGRLLLSKASDMTSLLTQEDVKNYVEECVKTILSSNAHVSSNSSITPLEEEKKEKIFDGPSRTVDENEERFEETEDNEESDSVEINQSLLSGLGAFFG